MNFFPKQICYITILVTSINFINERLGFFDKTLINYN